MKLIGRQKLTTANQWQRLPNGGFRCGNVEIHRAAKVNQDEMIYQPWYIYERVNGDLVLRMPAGRQWGYGHPGQAKIGAALMAAHQRRNRGGNG